MKEERSGAMAQTCCHESPEGKKIKGKKKRKGGGETGIGNPVLLYGRRRNRGYAISWRKRTKKKNTEARQTELKKEAVGGERIERIPHSAFFHQLLCN